MLYERKYVTVHNTEYLEMELTSNSEYRLVAVLPYGIHGTYLIFEREVDLNNVPLEIV